MPDPESYVAWVRIAGEWRVVCKGIDDATCRAIFLADPPEDFSGEWCILPRGRHPDDELPAPWDEPPSDRLFSAQQMDAMISHFASQLPRRLAREFDRLNQMVLRWLFAATEAIREAEEQAAAWEASCNAAMRALSAQASHGIDGKGKEVPLRGQAEQLAALRAELEMPKLPRRGGKP